MHPHESRADPSVFHYGTRVAVHPTEVLLKVPVIAFAISLVGSALGCTSTQSQGPAKEGAVPMASGSAQGPHKTPEDRQVYRFEFVVSQISAGKPPVTSNHVLTLEESSTGEIRVGSNVPLMIKAPGGATSVGTARQDVGLMIKVSFTPVGSDLLMEDSIEMSSVDDSGTIQKLNMKGDAVVSPGKPASIGSAEDPTTHAKVEVTVNATKLR
jgi:hypothetical protein